MHRVETQRQRRAAPKALLLFVLAGVGTSAAAQVERAGTWEVGFGIFEASSARVAGEGGSSLRVASRLGYTAVGGYHFTNRFALLGELSGSSPAYVARLRLDGAADVTTIRTKLDMGTLHIKGVFYFRESAVTPYVELGAGLTKIDSNIARGPPTTGCWWDPWWGFICTQLFETYQDTRFSYAGALGVRWDATPYINFKASVGLLEIDTSNRTERFSQSLLRAGFSWRF